MGLAEAEEALWPCIGSLLYLRYMVAAAFAPSQQSSEVKGEITKGEIWLRLILYSSVSSSS